MQDEKVEEIKDMSVKRERYSSDDDFQTPPSRFSNSKRQKSTSVRVVKEEKEVTRKPKCKATKGSKVVTINTRQSTRKLVKVLSKLSTQQQQILKGMGFECLIGFQIHAIPTTLAYWVVDNFDDKNCAFRIGDTSHEITSISVHKILGFPMGQKKVKAVSRAGVGKSNITSEWRNQFGNGSNKIYFKELIKEIKDNKEGGKFFRLNMMVLIMTTLAEAGCKGGTVNQKFLPGILSEEDIPNMDWCGYVLECLKRSKCKWDRNKETSWYIGPLLFLVVWYVHTAGGSSRTKELEVPVIQYWSSSLLDKWEEDELKAGGFGSISMMHNRQTKAPCVVEADTTPTQKSGDQTTKKEKFCMDESNFPNAKGLVTHGDAPVLGNENVAPRNVVGAEANEEGDRKEDENATENGRNGNLRYSKYGSQELSEHICTPIGCMGRVEKDENGTLDYSAEECEYDIKKSFNLFCCTMDEIEKKVEDAFRKYPDNEGIKVTARWVKENMSNVVRDSRIIGNVKRGDSVNNGCFNVDKTNVETETWTQILQAPGMWEKQIEFANDTLEKIKRGVNVNNGDAASYNVHDGPSFSLGISPVQLDNSELGCLHRKRLSLKECSKVVTKLQFCNPSKKESPKQAEGEDCGMRTPISIIHGDELRESSGLIGKSMALVNQVGIANKEMSETVRGVKECEKPLEDAGNVAGKYDVGIPKKDVLVGKKKKIESCKVPINVRRGDRISKPATAKRSPYYERVVNIKEGLNRSECEIANCVFAAVAPEYEFIFKYAPGTEMARVIFESLIPDSLVHAGVIEAWACILNYEQRFKSDRSQDRIFCGIGLMSDNMAKHEMGTPEKYTMFKNNMDVVLKKTNTCIGDAELVVIPIIRNRHFYLICFNVKKSRCYVIDNLEFGGASLEGYGNIPELVKMLFGMYLDASGHPNAYRLEISQIQRLEMSWRTIDNFVDCGVFTMRHMETFTDEGLLDWDAGLVKEGVTQKQQLNYLRYKYLKKILLSNANELKKNVLTDLQKFKQRTLDSRKQLRATAKERIERRLKKYA